MRLAREQKNGKHILALNSFIIDKSKWTVKFQTALIVVISSSIFSEFTFILNSFFDAYTKNSFIIFGVALCIERRKLFGDMLSKK